MYAHLASNFLHNPGQPWTQELPDYIYIYYGYGSKQVAYLQLSITEVMNF